MEYLLDTNICIYIIKKKPEEVRQRFLKIPMGQIGISSITLAELHYGVCKSMHPEKNLRALNQFLVSLEIYDFDFYSAIEYGEVKGDLDRKGLPIGPLDTLIAAHAKRLEFTLVTNNEKEFTRVVGLKVENWVN